MDRLREFEYVAHQVHFCDHCMHEILPGDVYKGTVYATNSSVLVLKEHHYPPCPVDPIEEQEEMERMMRESREKEKTCENAKVAA